MGMHEEKALKKDKQEKFFLRTLQVLPGSVASYDSQRVTIAFFAISGLDLLNSLHVVDKIRPSIVSWLYNNLINTDSPYHSPGGRCGFRGSSTFKVGSGEAPTHLHDFSHIAMTYTALASLLILGDDLSRLNRENIAQGLRALQLPDGSFKAAAEGGENDMRFLYCATAISYMIDDWSGVDKEKATQYVLDSLSYEGGFGQGPWLEAHGGSTYCAVAALKLMGKLDLLGEERLNRIGRWCISRQITGFQGRPNKPEDTCYTFWLGATLSMLGLSAHLDWTPIQEFVLSTQDPVTGGLAKWPDTQPDSLHAYLGLSGLSLRPGANLQPVEPALNISQRAARHLAALHNMWQRRS